MNCVLSEYVDCRSLYLYYDNKNNIGQIGLYSYMYFFNWVAHIYVIVLETKDPSCTGGEGGYAHIAQVSDLCW